MPVAKREWERAEVQRSHEEAMSTSTSRLRVAERVVARYLSPPLDSAFPLEYAYALLGDIRGLTVLDFGCGSGENSLLLARRGGHVVGVDISTSLIQLAKRRLEINGLSGTARFVVGSVHDLPLATESVDVVMGIAVLHHLDLDLASHELFRVLKIGGRAVFKEPVRNSRLLKAVRKVIPYRTANVSPFERPLTSSELGRFASPFRTEAVRAFSLPFVNVAQAVSPRHLNQVYRIDGALLKRFPALTPLAAIRVLALSKPTASPRTVGADVHDSERF
jgi:SAM-dependent methyltransferase